MLSFETDGLAEFSQMAKLSFRLMVLLSFSPMALLSLSLMAVLSFSLNSASWHAKCKPLMALPSFNPDGIAEFQARWHC
jgi:hypothetical protein